jgi:predicted tellurium resistance membrane protein TerC
MGMRILLLLSLSWIFGLTEPLFSLFPTIKMLALSFLLLIGTMLIAEVSDITSNRATSVSRWRSRSSSRCSACACAVVVILLYISAKTYNCPGATRVVELSLRCSNLRKRLQAVQRPCWKRVWAS